MMRTTLTILALLALATVCAAQGAGGSAQHTIHFSIREIAVLSLNDSGAVGFSIDLPAGGGSPPIVGGGTGPGGTENSRRDDSKFLNYTSMVPSGATRSLSVSMGPGDRLPPGTSLAVMAMGVNGASGTGVGPFELTTSQQELVRGIGNCATGTGRTGANVVFDFSIRDATQLAVDESSVTVVYTLTESGNGK